MVDRVIGRKRKDGVSAVHRAAACEDKVRAFDGSCDFEHRKLSGEIRIEIVERMIDRVTYAGLGREVHDPIQATFLEPCDDSPIREIQLLKVELRVLSKLRKPRLLEGRIVVVVHRVHAENTFTSFEQRSSDVEADESRYARDKYRQVLKFQRFYEIPARFGRSV